MKKYIENILNNPVFILEKNITDRKNSGVGLLFNGKLPFAKKIGFILIIIGFLFLFSRFSASGRFLKLVYTPCIIFLFFYFCTRSFYSGVNAIEKELQNKTFDKLITTLLPPKEIIAGKFWGAFLPVVKGIVEFFLLFAVITVFMNYNPVSLMVRFFMLLISSAIFLMFGIRYAIEPKKGDVGKEKHRKLLFTFLNFFLILVFSGMLIMQFLPILGSFFGGEFGDGMGMGFKVIFTNQVPLYNSVQFNSIFTLLLIVSAFLFASYIVWSSEIKYASLKFEEICGFTTNRKPIKKA